MDQIVALGTSDTVIRVDDIAGSDQDNIKRMFLAAYIIFEQLDQCKAEGYQLFTSIEESEAWLACFPPNKAPEFPNYHHVAVDRKDI